MSATVRTEVVMNPLAVAELRMSPQLREMLQKAADQGAQALTRAAPVRSGAGRASIRSWTEIRDGGWIGAAGWDSEHYYMGIRNARTQWATAAAQQVRFV